MSDVRLMGGVRVGVAEGVFPVGRNSMLLQPGFAVALGFLVFCRSEVGRVGGASSMHLPMHLHIVLVHE